MATEVAHDVVHVARTISDHMPILAVLVPFLGAPLAVLIGDRGVAWTLALATSAFSFFLSCMMLSQVIDGGYISYYIGGWAPPLGIEYRIDAANALVMMLISGISTIVVPYAYRSVQAEIPKRNHTLFYACYMLCMTGLMGVVATGDAFNVFVFLEISSLSTYVLVSMGSYRDKRALTAAYDYLIMGTIGATFFVIGLGMLYMMTGTLNMADLADRIQEQGMNRTLLVAFGFIVVGMGLKAAIFPLHLWLPGAYVRAPSAVTIFLASTATKAAIYVVLRFMFSVFQPWFVAETVTPTLMILPLALIAMFAASFVAVFQTDMKRMLAYSSIAQVGYMLLGLALLNINGLSATLIHLVNHGITKGALFMGVGAIVLRTNSSFYNRVQGMGRTMPLTAAAMVVGGLSLIGIPGTAGFVSKFVLIQAAFDRGWWVVAFLIVLSSLLAVIYVWRMFEVLYLQAPAKAGRAEAPLSMLVPMWILAGACLWFGIDTSLTLSAATAAAESLLSGSLGMAGSH